ncbi:hypothetical protein [Caballeronia grimmiae]|uniref:hypothetical protein n=1 Tax=Caballeronia grimmiae TaxID=1071679 RepID=UPI0038BCA8E7
MEFDCSAWPTQLDDLSVTVDRYHVGDDGPLLNTFPPLFETRDLSAVLSRTGTGRPCFFVNEAQRE